MKNNETKTWLWLEDEFRTIQDIVAKFPLNYKQFNTVGALIDFLIIEKQKERLKDYGLILDVLLKGNQYIYLPTEWNHASKIPYIKTEMGYDVGVVFYEELIMNKSNNWEPIWNPPPPIIFLTVIPFDPQMEIRINEIKIAWGNTHHIEAEFAKVKWVRKWDVEYQDSEFYQLLNEWGGGK
jgi:hypothetical protein